MIAASLCKDFNVARYSKSIEDQGEVSLHTIQCEGTAYTENFPQNRTELLPVVEARFHPCVERLVV